MSLVEYFHVFDSILYGIIIARILVGMSNMIIYRRSIKFYWAHLLLVILGFLIAVENYFSHFRQQYFEYISNAWMFFILLVVPLSLLFVIVYLSFPKKFKNTDFKEFIVVRQKELLIVMLAFSISTNIRLFIGDLFLLDRGIISIETYIISERFLLLLVPIFTFSLLIGVALLIRKLWPFEIIVVLGFLYISYLMVIR